METCPQPSTRRKIVFGLLVAMLLLALAEVLVRCFLPAPERSVPVAFAEAIRSMGWEPNAADERLLRDDPRTLWSLVPDYSGVLPSYVAAGAPWQVSTGPHGYRGAPPSPSPPGPRIACVGNSCTFGLLINDDETWPARLRQLLRTQGHEDIEVLNFAVPGFSSEQGRLILAEEVLPLAPDLVVLAFGFNDRWPAPVADRERLASHWGMAVPLRRGMRHLALFRALEETFRSRSAPRDLAASDHPRVSPERTRENLREMIEATRAAGARPLLLALDFPHAATAEIGVELAAETGVPFVDARHAFGADWRQEPRALLIEALQPASRVATGQTRRQRFEVAVPSHLPRPIALVGNAVACAVPGTTILPDDGHGPDRRAGDGIHTLEIELPAALELRYLFQCGAAAGSWQGLESPCAYRRAGPEMGRQRFGRLPLLAEPIHPSALGCEAIALVVADEILAQALLMDSSAE